MNSAVINHSFTSSIYYLFYKHYWLTCVCKTIFINIFYSLIQLLKEYVFMMDILQYNNFFN